MRILCLIAFVFLATSFTTNNENFENVSNSESLEIVKPTEEYRVNAYKKSYGYGGTINWEKKTIKIRVTSSSTYGGGEDIEVISIYEGDIVGWMAVSNKYMYMVQKTNQYTDGQDVASRFDYKAGDLYFSF